MKSYGDTSKDLNAYLAWELKDAGGNPLDTDGRPQKFQERVERMLIKNLKWNATDSAAWVKNVVWPNNLTSVHEFAAASDLDVTPRSSWSATWPDPNKG